jgi:hypothetical protein
VVLYEYNITDTNLNKYSPTKPESKHSKKDKPDFESLTHFQDTLYIFGSAHNKRNAMIEFEKTKKTMTNNLVDLYAVMFWIHKIRRF